MRGIDARESHPVLMGAAFVLAACAVGAAIPVYVGVAGDGLGRLMVLPAAIALAALTLLNPRLLFLMIVVLRASGDLLLESSKLSIAGQQLGAGALINGVVILIALMLFVEKPAAVPKSVLRIWGAFLATSLVAVLLAPMKGDAVRVYLGFVSYFAIFVSAFYFVRSREEFRSMVRLVIWSSAIPALFAAVDSALNAGAAGFRLQSTFGHPNIFAFYLALIITLILYLLKSAAPALLTPGRFALGVYAVFLVALLVLTQTRSAWIACVLVFALYGLIHERRYLVYLAVAAVIALLFPGIRDRVLDLGSNNELVQYAKLNSFAWRMLIWESGLEWMQPGHYLFGYGVNAFKFYSPMFFPLAGQANFGAHNVYVQWLFEAGVAGLAALLWLFGRMVFTVRKMHAIDGMGAFFVTMLVIEYLVVSFSDNLLVYLVYNWYFWLIAGAACALVEAEQAPGMAAKAHHPGQVKMPMARGMVRS